MSDPPNPYRLQQTTGAPTSPPVPPPAPAPTTPGLPAKSTQEQATHALLDTPAGQVRIQTTYNRITVNNETGDRIVDTSTTRAASLDGNILDEKTAVACPRCKRAPYTTDDIAPCATCGRRGCKKRCLKKNGTDWRCKPCRSTAAIRKAFAWLTTR